MKRHTVYEVEPVVRELPVSELSDEAQRGVHYIIDHLKDSGDFPYTRGGGGGGFIGLEDAMKNRLAPAIESSEDSCPKGYLCTLELECEGASQGNANQIVVELRCKGASLESKTEAELFEKSREHCVSLQKDVVRQVDKRLAQVPDRVAGAAFALQDATAKVNAAQIALKEAYNL